MRRVRELLARITGYARRGSAERDLDREIRAHLDFLIEEHTRAGSSPAEARALALRALGGVDQTKEAQRDQRGFAGVETALRDLVHAARLFRIRPWLSVSIILSIALGIGVNTAVFSVAYGVLWRPLPYADPDRLVRLFQVSPTGEEGPISPLNYQDWGRLSHSLDGLAAWAGSSYTVRGADRDEAVGGARVSASLFRVLGVQPALGRPFRADEDKPGGPPVAIVSDRFWRTRYDARPDVVGRAFVVGQTRYTIVGVLPPGVMFPAENAEIWTPLRLGDATHRMRRSENYLSVIARHRGDASLAQVRDDLTRVAGVLAAEFPLTNAGARIAAAPLVESMSGSVRAPLILLLGVAVSVLLIACANVAHLLLVRASARRQELALRAALGASGLRLVWQSVAETLLLALAGAAAGVLFAWAVIGALRPLLPETLPRRHAIAVDPVALTYALALALAVALVCAAAPALFSRRVSVDSELRSGRPTAAGGATRLGRLVVVLQVSLSLVLLVGALLTVQSLRNLLTADAGFDARRVIVMPVGAPFTGGVTQPSEVVQHFERVLERVDRIPGVEAAGLVSHLPLGGDSSGTRFTIERRVFRVEEVPTASYRVVSPSYLDTLGARLLRGRHLTMADRADTTPVCLINERLRARFWPTQDPVGVRIRRGGLDSDRPYITIVGVVADMKQQALDREVAGEIFIPHSQFPWPEMNLAVRASRRLQDVIPEARAALRELNPLQPAPAVRPFEEIVWRTLSGRTFASLLLGGSSLLALLLALLGVHATMAYATSRRNREIAIRLALGGPPATILRALFGQTMTLVLVGQTLGMVGAWLAARLMATQLVGVAPFDPAIYACAALAIGAIALIAALEPARRALRVDPLVSLKAE
jgi:putative ABC transport system permease protein